MLQENTTPTEKKQQYYRPSWATSWEFPPPAPQPPESVTIPIETTTITYNSSRVPSIFNWIGPLLFSGAPNVDPNSHAPVYTVESRVVMVRKEHAEQASSVTRNTDYKEKRKAYKSLRKGCLFCV
jgi:hypothetical protein